MYTPEQIDMLDSTRIVTFPESSRVRIVPINPTDPRQDRLEAAVQALDTGQLVAIPTETFYGLAGDASNAEALKRINLVKQKPADSPVLLLVANAQQARDVAGEIPDKFEVLAERFWPGPLTMVIPASPQLPKEVSGGRGTVAVRVSSSILSRRLAAALGRPITGVSANIHRKPACRTAVDVARAFPTGVYMLLDGGTTPGGAASTVVDLSGLFPRILRLGIIPLSSLRPFLPDL
jgi:L-threonylcarbamoyladenylate synthase